MVRLFATLMGILFLNLGIAQDFHPDYEDEFIGWVKVYRYKGYTKSLQVDEKTYSAAQLSIADSLANWMQASYVPKGVLGDIKKYLTPRKNLYAERYNEAVPHSYGARAELYRFLKKVNGKWTPENNLGYYWKIAANEIPLSFREADFNTNKTCLFTLPFYDDKDIADNPRSATAQTKDLFDLTNHPILKKYLPYNLDKYHDDFGHNLVILSKDNRSPFIQVTIGEALRVATEALPQKYAEEKQSVIEQKSYDAGQLKLAMDNLDEKYARARRALGQLREKYKNRLNEYAYLPYGGYSIQGLANGADIFANGEAKSNGIFSKRFPLYQVDPAMQVLCKSDKPQWILITWYGGSLDDPSFRHLHESILNNFDFDYVYNFFFDPAKVKGRTYKPLRSPRLE